MNDMKILDVNPASPLYGHVRPGYRVVSINGREVLDSIDFRFRTADEQFRIKIADPSGEESDFQFSQGDTADLGLTLDDSRVLTCKNKCIFCFVHQQPKGMRRELYIMDEDYRLSFTHGNFITLSNVSDEDIERIIGQRLSPLYVSVHATDDKLRRCMMRNEKLAPIVPRIRHLTENGITIQTQVVLCPGINDGAQLENTIEQLSALYPGVQTLAVVPVGLTRFRENLADLRTYRADEAATIIDKIEKFQKHFLTGIGTRFVWPADEFYVAAKRDFPGRTVYEEMQQFENGVGMARESITSFNRRRRHLKKIKSDKRVLFLTGHSAYPFLSTEFIPYLRDQIGLQISLDPVVNRFWGETVTVSGLLTGQDLLRQSRKRANEFDAVVLPPNCLNSNDLFLDNLTLDQFRSVLARPVFIGRYDLAATVREIYH